MNSLQKNSPAPYEGITRRIAVDQAARLACKGMYLEAKELLHATSAEKEPSPDVIALLGRIAAQQGLLDEARRHFTKLVELVPEDTSAVAALARINALLSSPYRMVPRLVYSVGAFLLLASIMCTVIPVFLASRHVNAKNNTPSSIHIEAAMNGTPGTSLFRKSERTEKSLLDAASPSESGENRQLPLRSIDSCISPVSPAQSAHTPIGARLFPSEHPHFSVRDSGVFCIIVFDSAVFSEGITLSRSGARALETVTKHLAPWGQSISIKCTGFTDNIPLRPQCRYRDNYALGMARSLAVANRISSGSNIPLHCFSIASRASLGSPFPNSNPAHSRKNRTVVLSISATEYPREMQTMLPK